MADKIYAVGAMPRAPKRKKGNQVGVKPDNNAYYLDVVTEAIKPMYRNGKTLAVEVSQQDYAKLQRLQRAKGSDFDLNSIIHKGFEMVNGHVVNAVAKDKSFVVTRTIQLKPDDESITALLKVGCKNAANHLLRLGMSYYEQRQEL